jgi:hypothetical protein
MRIIDTTKKVIVVINEQHSILDIQDRIIKDIFPEYSKALIDSQGLNLADQKSLCEYLFKNFQTVIFISPIPFMIKELSKIDSDRVLLMLNDTRIKKELPNGKIIFTISDTGWYLS